MSSDLSYQEMRYKKTMEQRDDDDRQDVTRWAKGYQSQVPGMPWGEAIRLAEKHKTEQRTAIIQAGH